MTALADPASVWMRENAEGLLVPPALALAFIPYLLLVGWTARYASTVLRRRFLARQVSS